MVKAKFIGDAENTSYQCAEFNAGSGNMVSMANARWDAIEATGKQGLFSIISRDEEVFPVQKTRGVK